MTRTLTLQPTNDEGNGEEGADDDQDVEATAESRPDIQARLRRALGVIVGDAEVDLLPDDLRLFSG